MRPTARGPSPLAGRASTRSDPARHVAPQVRQQRFGKGERDVDRRDLVDGDERRLIVGAHQVAGVDHQRAGAAGDRRADGGVLQLHLRVLDRGAIGGERGLERGDAGARGVALLARDDAALRRAARSAARSPWRSRPAPCRARGSPCACCSAASSGRRSSVNSSCPAWTSSPCWKLTDGELAGDLRAHRHRGIGLDGADDADLERHGLADHGADGDGRAAGAAAFC